MMIKWYELCRISWYPSNFMKLFLLLWVGLDSTQDYELWRVSIYRIKLKQKTHILKWHHLTIFSTGNNVLYDVSWHNFITGNDSKNILKKLSNEVWFFSRCLAVVWEMVGARWERLPPWFLCRCQHLFGGGNSEHLWCWSFGSFIVVFARLQGILNQKSKEVTFYWSYLLLMFCYQNPHHAQVHFVDTCVFGMIFSFLSSASCFGSRICDSPKTNSTRLVRGCFSFCIYDLRYHAL